MLIPKNKTLDASHLPDLVSTASPIAAASDFTICAEQDMSHDNYGPASAGPLFHTIVAEYSLLHCLNIRFGIYIWEQRRTTLCRSISATTP